MYLYCRFYGSVVFVLMQDEKNKFDNHLATPCFRDDRYGLHPSRMYKRSVSNSRASKMADTIVKATGSMDTDRKEQIIAVSTTTFAHQFPDSRVCGHNAYYWQSTTRITRFILADNGILRIVRGL